MIPTVAEGGRTRFRISIKAIRNAAAAIADAADGTSRYLLVIIADDLNLSTEDGLTN